MIINLNKEISTRFDSIITRHLYSYQAAIREVETVESCLKRARVHAENAGYNYFCSSYKYDFDDQCRSLKRETWLSLITSTKLIGLMDTKTKKKMYQDLSDNNSPELTKDNVFAVLIDLFNRRDEILAKSLLNVFYRLSPDYKSNDKLKLTDKRIIFYIGCGYSFRNEDFLTDLDRFFHYIDGKVFECDDHTKTLGYRVANDRPGEIITPYFKIRTFMNGNAHVYFLRKELIDQCNKLIAYYNKNKLGRAT